MVKNKKEILLEEKKLPKDDIKMNEPPIKLKDLVPKNYFGMCEDCE